MTRTLLPGSAEFSGLFDRFEHTAYRLEILQLYSEPSEAESLVGFLDGRRPEAHPGKRSWIALVREARRQGKIMQRVHAVTEPLSDYLRFEIGWSYELNDQAGEDVRVLTAPWPRGLPGADYWLFDSKVLVRMVYDQGGRMTAAQLVSDLAEVVEACYWRDAALHASVPYREYVAAARGPVFSEHRDLGGGIFRADGIPASPSGTGRGAEGLAQLYRLVRERVRSAPRLDTEPGQQDRDRQAVPHRG
jgi:hypothetical protein